MNSLLNSYFLSRVSTAESGFTPFYEDFVITHPVPQVDWICGETVQIIWNIGYNITNNVVTVPATPTSGKVNIYLANPNGLPTASRISKELILSDADIDTTVHEYEVDCSALCKDCLTDADANVEFGFLYVEDADSENCDKNQLNYDNPNCWSVRSQGAVHVGQKKRHQPSVLPGDNVWTREQYWMPEGNIDLSLDLPNLGVVASHLAQYWVPDSTDVELPYGFGSFEVLFDHYDGVIGAFIIRSVVENVIVVAFRETTGGIYLYDDWMTNFWINQNSCEGIDDTGPLLASCDRNMKLHRGYLYEYEITKNEIRETLLRAVEDNLRCRDDDSSTTWRIVFTGMSQGGGLAQIAIYDNYNHLQNSLDTDDFDTLDIHLYTYGTPPVGNEVFALWMEDTIPYQNRERFVVRFEGDFPFAPYRWTDIGTDSMNLATFDTASDCLNVPPPNGKDTPAYAGWEWQDKSELGDDYLSATEDEVLLANSVMWFTGDFVPMMEISTLCKNHSVFLHLDSRYEEVVDPVYVQVDSDLLSRWCGPEGCTGIPSSERNPPHPNAKEAISLYPNDMKNKLEGDGCSYSGERANAAPDAMSCHSMPNYAYGVAKWSRQSDTIIDHRYFNPVKATCDANGTELDRSTGLPHTTTTTVEPTDDDELTNGAYEFRNTSRLLHLLISIAFA